MGFGIKSWIEAGGTKKVERQGSMRDEAVPEMQGEVGVETAKVSNKVILVGLYGAFGGVGAMQVRRNELEIDARSRRNCFSPTGNSLSGIWY